MRGIKKSARHQERAKKLEHTGRDRSHHRMPFFSGPPYVALALQLSRSSQHLLLGKSLQSPYYARKPNKPLKLELLLKVIISTSFGGRNTAHLWGSEDNLQGLVLDPRLALRGSSASQILDL